MKNQSYFAHTLLGLAILALASAMAAGQDDVSSSNTPGGEAKGHTPIYGLLTNNNNPDGNSLSAYALKGGSLQDLSDARLVGSGGSNPCLYCIIAVPIPQYICSVVVDQANPNNGYPYGDIEVVRTYNVPLYFQHLAVVQTIAAPMDQQGNQWTTLNATVSYTTTPPNNPPVKTLVVVSYTLYGYADQGTYTPYLVNPDCTLTTYVPPPPPHPLRVESSAGIPQQNRKSSSAGTAFAYSDQNVGSVSILKGKVVEHGPYTSQGNAADVQVSSDGRFAIFGDNTTGAPQIEVYPINSDNSLGKERVYSNLGPGSNSSNILLSPDQRFLFVGNTSSGQVTTLNFNRKSGAVSYACISPVLNGFGANWATTEGMATETAKGAGGYLYLAEDAGGLSANSSIGVLAIDQKTGCVTEISGSPFPNVNSPGSFALVSATIK